MKILLFIDACHLWSHKDTFQLNSHLLLWCPNATVAPTELELALARNPVTQDGAQEPNYRLVPISNISQGSNVQYQSNETSTFTDANHSITHVLFSTTE